MLIKNKLHEQVNDELLKLGNNINNFFKYDIEIKNDDFQYIYLKMFKRMLSENYLFCFNTYNEDNTLEIINTTING
jgi:hypothetical protein